MSKGYGDCQETTIFCEEFADGCFFKEFLAIFSNVKHDVSAAVCLVHLCNFKLWRTIASPLHRLSTFLIATRNDIHTFAHHKGRVETETEMTNNSISIILVTFKEVCSTREGNLIDVLFNLLGRHTNTTVTYSKCFCLGINLNLHSQVTEFTTHLSTRAKSLQLLRSVNGICNYFTKENLMITIQEFLNHGENILRSYSNLSFFHNIGSLSYEFHFYKKKCK